VGLSFADGSAVTLATAADGQSLQLGDEQLRDYAMGAYGRVEVRRDGPPCDVLRPGATIRAALPLIGEDAITIGLRVETDSGVVHIYTSGDELRIRRLGPRASARPFTPRAASTRRTPAASRASTR
jgi:hypothetical protein